MKNSFVGIDFSKATIDVSVISGNNLLSEKKHKRFQNNSKGFTVMIAWLNKIGIAQKNEMLFCGEHTGIYSKAISDLLAENGYAMWLENPLQIKRSIGIRRGKNDKQDSGDIAEYAARHCDKAVLHKKPSKSTERLEAITMIRKQITEQKQSLQQTLSEYGEFLESDEILKSLKELVQQELDDRKKTIKELNKQAEEEVKKDPEIAENYQILTSMQGIGPVNAIELILATDNFSRFNLDARKICSYYGIAPFAHTSGTSLNGKPHVSHYANSYLKSILSEAVLCAKRYCPAIRDYAERLKAKGKHPSIILNNCKNKMIHILVSMIKHKTPYEEHRLL